MMLKIFQGAILGKVLGLILLSGSVLGVLATSTDSVSAFHFPQMVIVKVADESPDLHEAYWGETDVSMIIETKALYKGANFLTGVGLKLNKAVVAKAELFDNQDNLLQSIDVTGSKRIKFDLLGGSDVDLPRIPSDCWRQFHISFTYIDNADGKYEDGFHMQSRLWSKGFKGWYINPKNNKWRPLRFILSKTQEPAFEAILINSPSQEIPEFNVVTLTVPLAQNIVAGEQDFDWMYAEIINESTDEDILVTEVKIEDTLGDADDDFNAITNAAIWADLDGNGSYETKVSSTKQFTDNGLPVETHSFALTQNIIIETSIKIALRADLSTSANAGDTHTIRVSEITAAGMDSGSNASGSYEGTGQTMMVVVAGSITTAVAASNPDATLIVASTTNYAILGAFRLMATDEAFIVTKLTLDMTNGWESAEKVKISYPTKTGTATREISISSAAIVFDNIDMYVPENGNAVVTASATTKRIGTGMGGTFNDAIQIGIDMDAAAEFAAVGESSGIVLDGNSPGTDDRNGNIMYLYNTIPTIIATNPYGAGTIIPGITVDLYKFRVVADMAGEVAVKRFTFSIFISDASTTEPSAADLGGFTFIRDGMDITSSTQITQISNDGGATHLATPLSIETLGINNLENNTPYWVQVAFANTPATDGEQVIAAGETVTYTLRAVCGTGFTTNDAFSTVLLGDTVSSAGYTYLSDADADTGVEQIVILQNAVGTQFGDATMTDTEQTKFIWSDISVLDHIPTFDDDGVTETSSADWTNSYLVKNFPLSSYSYIL